MDQHLWDKGKLGAKLHAGEHHVQLKQDGVVAGIVPHTLHKRWGEHSVPTTGVFHVLQPSLMDEERRVDKKKAEAKSP